MPLTPIFGWYDKRDLNETPCNAAHTYIMVYIKNERKEIPPSPVEL